MYANVMPLGAVAEKNLILFVFALCSTKVIKFIHLTKPQLRLAAVSGRILSSRNINLYKFLKIKFSRVKQLGFLLSILP